MWTPMQTVEQQGTRQISGELHGTQQHCVLAAGELQGKSKGTSGEFQGNSKGTTGKLLTVILHQGHHVN